MIFPYNPNAGDSLRIAVNTAQFTYDTFGNITQANNRYARITRTYFPGGALQSDTTALGVYTLPLTDGTKRGQKYTYDLSGKRTSMQWYLGTTGYSYNDFGGLDVVTDPNSNHYHIAYTLDGHVDSLMLGTGVSEKRGYDADGRLISKNRISSYAGVGTLVTDALNYDRMNRVIHSVEQNHGAVPDETWITYDGLGAVISSEQGSAYGTNIQEFRNDALGNVLYRKSQRTAGTNSAPFVNQYSPVGEMLTSFSHLSSPPGQQELGDTLKQNFAGGGQLNREDRIERNPNDGSVSLELASKHYYGADDKLMAVQRYMVLSNGSVRNGTWEEYWYDALGRRVLTRAARDSSKYDASISGPLCAYPSQCGSFKERVWWDGNQALVEERTPEGYTNDVSNSGVVGNIHGLTLDEPLAVMSDQTRIINYTWRGLGESSVFTNGQAGDNSLGNPATEIDWPAATQAETYFTPGPGSGSSGNPKRWMGTFVANGQGTTGMLYRRNRYFNPNGGQFTQADPVGIAGGMNAFGFAQGDPINLRDPFGLCPLDDGIPCAVVFAGWGTGGGMILGGLVGAAGGSLVLPGIGTVAGIEPGAVAGGALLGLVGGTIGSLVDGISFMGRATNRIPIVGGPPNTVVTRPGVSVEYGPEGNAVKRTCAKSGHGCEGAHTHDYTTGPNGKVNQKGKARPATEEEKKRTPPPNDQ
jgi:RHS repeat-associated protein